MRTPPRSDLLTRRTSRSRRRTRGRGRLLETASGPGSPFEAKWSCGLSELTQAAARPRTRRRRPGRRPHPPRRAPAPVRRVEVRRVGIVRTVTAERAAPHLGGAQLVAARRQRFVREHQARGFHGDRSGGRSGDQRPGVGGGDPHEEGARRISEPVSPVSRTVTGTPSSSSPGIGQHGAPSAHEDLRATSRSSPRGALARAVGGAPAVATSGAPPERYVPTQRRADSGRPCSTEQA